ncbi:hypothetical protein [Pedobacter jeongneungensis]|uniref:hypothetical protein n=1 Tax=Pedobacter jeongneungensis TaxID=947309 RepID=UPI0004696C14|nr:hypothetical protein [Pedobacter jeongneungensis]
MELPIEIQAEFDSLFELNEHYFEAGKYDKCIEIHEQAWSLFPHPKYDYLEEGYALLQGLVYLNLKVGKIMESEKWARQLYLFDQSSLLGTTEFALGQVYYEMERMDEAKEQLAIAMLKSEGRIFENEDPKYLTLLAE